MDLKITAEAVARMKDKDSKRKEYRELYEQRPFIDAYAEHTNMRVADNPKGAIGREDEWESHGKLQLEFLKSVGMKPTAHFLDVGCGVGRLARKVVPYLNACGYVGVDISEAALDHARQLSVTEGWENRTPLFFQNADLDLPFLPHNRTFDFAWAHSVFTHLPPQQIEVMVANIAKLLVPGGTFLFTYKKADRPQRSGLKQFQYPPQYFARVASECGLVGMPMSEQWPAGQQTFAMHKPA